ncbi:ABC transporter permease [Fusibacter tunisiensis]|uniref:ABC-type dipeptide/oligopeptide/nickel transport system permease subunit n=1 Tax=Fusibacter tunisiensis TaxID=1008308 RepID=A0ABS2MSM3_9FIRM|nr:ABC transporter permease [Fusibacter tunisiensis]MBM7562416.1 ABC-type dipeptide/oligopeptide/nickel transport system permease subunit [Fusibacter tunisiensis]
MQKNDDLKQKNISADQFEFVQKDEKLYDQELEGRPIGYFEDVWIRFRKNRTNLTASIILLILIVSSIIMPFISGKEYNRIDEKIAFLPPRVPVLEKFGIFDGIVSHEEMPVDLNTYDEATGLYYPMGYNQKAIIEGTLTNSTIPSNEKSPSVLNGQALMVLDYDSNTMTIQSTEFFTLSKANNGILELDVYEMDTASNGKLEVMLQTDFGGEYKVLATIEEPGKHAINVFDLNPDLYADVVSTLRLRYTADAGRSSVAISSISVLESGSETPVFENQGFSLSEYKIVDGKGSYQRQNAEMIVATFEYNKYLAAFDLTREIAFSSAEYDQLIEEAGGNVKKIPNPDNPEGWFFEEGFPIREVIRKNDTVKVDGKEYSSYEVMLDYKTYLGYENLPYFLFGTTSAGRDLFSLVWVGLRTSLLIGLIVTAINVSVGVVYGAISGFYGGVVDILMERFSEIMGRIPWLVVLSIMVVLFDPGIKTLILTLIINGWIGTAGVTRMQFYRYKGREYVLASKTMGAKDGRLIFRHILPNGIGTIITASILSIPGVIFTESALSFLGYGIGHGQSFNFFGLTFSGVSIGVLLSDGRNFLLNYPHLVIFPALIVSILMITFNMFGNALRDAFNPSLRGVE